jgi:hypothetical protein
MTDIALMDKKLGVTGTARYHEDIGKYIGKLDCMDGQAISFLIEFEGDSIQELDTSFARAAREYAEITALIECLEG